MCGNIDSTIPLVKRGEQNFFSTWTPAVNTPYTERVKRCAIIGCFYFPESYTYRNLPIAKKIILGLNIGNDKAAGESRTALLLLKAGDKHTGGRTGAIPAFFYLKNYQIERNKS